MSAPADLSDDVETARAVHQAVLQRRPDLEPRLELGADQPLVMLTADDGATLAVLPLTMQCLVQWGVLDLTTRRPRFPAGPGTDALVDLLLATAADHSPG